MSADGDKAKAAQIREEIGAFMKPVLNYMNICEKEGFRVLLPIVFNDAKKEWSVPEIKIIKVQEF